MASGCSAVLILDQKGKVLISRNYRGDVPYNVADRFVSFVAEHEVLLSGPLRHSPLLSYVG